MRTKQIYCSFCGRSSREALVFPGPNEANICADCAKHITDAVSDAEKAAQEEEKKLPALGPVPSPKEIKAFLDKYVIGHDETKKILAVSVHNHYRRLEQKEGGKGKDANPAFDDVEIEKSNILLIGPTGTGKTLFAKTLARMLKVPYAIGDATTLTEAGYVGEDVENLVRYLLQNAGGDVELAKRGIIYVDEIDKIASKTDNVSITRDVSGEGLKARSVAFRRKVGASIPTKSILKSIRPTFFSFVEAHLWGWTASSATVRGGGPSATGRTKRSVRQRRMRNLRRWMCGRRIW